MLNVFRTLYFRMNNSGDERNANVAYRMKYNELSIMELI